jgi:adenylate cyclase
LAARLVAGDHALADQLLAELRQSRLLNQVAEAVNGPGGLDAILPRLVSLMATALDADRATLFLHDAEARQLFSRVASDNGVLEIRIPENGGIAGAVFRSGKAERIDDAYADTRFNRAVDQSTGYKTKTILAAPVLAADGRTVGVVQLLNKAGGPFTETDQDQTLSMARQAASALEKAWLHEQLERAKQDETKLLEMAEWVSSELDLDRLLSRVGDVTMELLDCERATIFVLDPDKNELVSRVASGGNVKEIRIPTSAGVAGAAFMSHKIDNVPDAYADPRFNQAVDKATGFNTRSILAAPILDRNGASVGVVQALNKRGGPFGPDEERRVRAFSSQLAVALQNAQLFSDVLSLKNYNEGILKSLSTAS